MPQSHTPQLEGGTYELIQKRLHSHSDELRKRLDQLNEARKEVFGAIETTLIANDRITTENNCTPRDMVAIGNHFLFGYNVHIGLRTETRLEDVFSMYRFEATDHSFHQEPMEMLVHPQFEEDFQNLYKYYKGTVFAKFAVIGPHLYMVFQVGKGVTDIKTFKWLIKEDSLSYLGNRFEHEFRFPDQHEFQWRRITREMHRRGKHPHISILDRVFVETLNGSMTIKVEDNTDSGKGIYDEPVEHADQTLDDADFAFADLGNLIVLKIRPYQEKQYRYLIFNEKMQEALRVDSLEDACVLLPDNQGIIFANGYYLQTGEYKIFDNVIRDMHFEKRIPSPNGEDFLFMFYNQLDGLYVLLPYNLVEMKVDTPILCSGFSLFPNGELCYFRAEEEAGRHHVVQVWQTPYSLTERFPTQQVDSYLNKVGNKDLVRGMAECKEMLILVNKGDSYGNLYIDLVKKAGDILDSYYWIKKKETFQLDKPLVEVQNAAAAAIDEFEKVRRVRQHTRDQVAAVADKLSELQGRIKRYKAKDIDTFVGYLSSLRILRGEIISLRDLRYVSTEEIDAFDQQVMTDSETISQDMVGHLLEEKALQPYWEKVATQKKAAEAVTKVAEAKTVGDQVDQIGKELEMLIEIVSNLKIEDATQTTRIIDNISEIYTGLNQLRADLKNRRKSFRSTEAAAEFQSQLKLLDQGLINYIDLCDTPAKCEEYLTKLMVQVEELEGKFAEFDEFVLQITEKREEIYGAFETRRLGLVESRNKRASALMSSAERILKGIRNRLAGFEEINEIHTYFAADLMIEKVRDVVAKLEELDDSIKAGDIQSQLKTLREDAVRQLKDRKELFVGGENIIKLGRHHFPVNVQNLDLTLVPREGEIFYHLSGTNFFERVDDPEFLETVSVWDQSLPSENREVYRAEWLAYQMKDLKELRELTDFENLRRIVRNFMTPRFNEGYTKGVHDEDASLMLGALLEIEAKIGLLKYRPEVRACAQVCWHSFLGDEDKELFQKRLKGAGVVVQVFPGTQEFGELIRDLQEHIRAFAGLSGLFDEGLVEEAGEYLFYERSRQDTFSISREAADLYTAFHAFLKKKKATAQFNSSVDPLKGAPEERFELIRNWLHAYVAESGLELNTGYQDETAALIFADSYDVKQVAAVSPLRELNGFAGDHGKIQEKQYQLDYHDFMVRMRRFEQETLPMYQRFTELKKELANRFRSEIRLEEFRPRVLSSFVRNQLIDQVYLPVIGDNLAKQMGTAGENTRTDRMGMLLLISPPGYGKTTLMEYVANRLGLIFMKINGPAIGHQVTSLDPVEAPNAAAREELQRLNLAFEMGDNVMIYVDDIQHCHPEFLQKFISLCDAQRKIEGVYKGRTRTYDLRGRKVAVVMAGNPYTESGERFQIPDMLANRADTYNLGDILGDNEQAFRISYLENSLTSNPVLNRLATRPQEDIYSLIRIAETGEMEGVEFSTHISPEDLNEYISVLQKMATIRDTVSTVNQAYIRSAAQQELYRKEPPFRLQGSYRNMNKLAEKVVPIMNEEELKTLILSHYEGESQTLTTGAEANLLQFKALNGLAEPADEARWQEICELFLQHKAVNVDRMAQLVAEMGAFSEGLTGIKDALEKGMNGE